MSLEAVLLNLPVPRGWRPSLCPDTRRVRWAHDTTGAETWTDPRYPLPPGWTEGPGGAASGPVFEYAPQAQVPAAPRTMGCV
jgi:hypothetical protein